MRAFKHITDNILRVAAINSVGAFVLFLGKLSIIIGTVVSGVYIINNKDRGSDGNAVNHIWIPCGIGGIIAYLIADTFIGVYSVTKKFLDLQTGRHFAVHVDGD